MTTKKQNSVIKNGYSLTEAKNIIDKYIDESAERLQKKLRIALKRQCATSRKLSYV